MDFIGGALPNVMLITGLIAIGIGLGLQFNIVEVKGNLSRTSRLGAVVVGLSLIGGSIYIHTHPPQVAATQADTQPTAAPAATAGAAAPAPAGPTAAPAPTAAPEAVVPDIRGKNTKDAEKLLAQAGLRLGDQDPACTTTGAVAEGKPKKDAITCQVPAPGSRVPPQSAINYLSPAKR
jgi:hypothetical protein